MWHTTIRTATSLSLMALLAVIPLGNTAADEAVQDATSLCASSAAANPLDNTMLDASAFALAAWITESRGAAFRDGVEPVPAAIRAQLEGFVPRDVLDQARWRVGGTNQLALQTHLSRLGLVAVTLGDVVVFSDAETARNNAGLWAHELRHVMQYRDCGIAGFARSYVRAYDALEEDARTYALRWHQWSLDRRLSEVP